MNNHCKNCKKQQDELAKGAELIFQLNDMRSDSPNRHNILERLNIMGNALAWAEKHKGGNHATK